MKQFEIKNHKSHIKICTCANFSVPLQAIYNNMRKLFVFIVFFCASLLCAHAETLLLRTGARVKGSIVLQNDEVVIIRDASGARFQYPRADVQEILSDEAEDRNSSDESALSAEPEIETTKKASVLLELAGGMSCVPAEKVGGAFSAGFLVGSHHIGNRHIFIGGGIGYHGMYLTSPVALKADRVISRYNFLPVMAAFRMPFMETKHAPVFGLSLGYGIALSKDYLGGAYVGVDFGYRCQLNTKTAVGAVFYTQFQQASIMSSAIIEGQEFDSKSGRNIVSFGTKFTLYF